MTSRPPWLYHFTKIQLPSECHWDEHHHHHRCDAMREPHCETMNNLNLYHICIFCMNKFGRFFPIELTSAMTWSRPAILDNMTNDWCYSLVFLRLHYNLFCISYSLICCLDSRSTPASILLQFTWSHTNIFHPCNFIAIVMVMALCDSRNDRTIGRGGQVSLNSSWNHKAHENNRPSPQLNMFIFAVVRKTFAIV